MARILIGNIKGPKGDTGAKGATGPQGPAGPQGPLPPLTNNALATTPGVSALDAVMGKTLQKQIDDANSDLVAINHNFANFATYETVTGGNVNTAESFLSGLKDIYTGIPDNCVFIIFASFSGTYVCLEGLKTTASYGIVTTTSYADAANKRYSILNGTWTLK